MRQILWIVFALVVAGGATFFAYSANTSSNARPAVAAPATPMVAKPAPVKPPADAAEKDAIGNLKIR